MGNLTTVTGIEFFATARSRGLALECNCCKITYMGGNGTDRPGPYRPAGYRGDEGQLLKEDALSIGWTGPMTYDSELDLCPTCSKEKIVDDELTVEFKPRPAKLFRWYRGKKHNNVIEEGGSAFFSLGTSDYKFLTRPISEGDYLVTVGDKLLHMTPKEVAETFQLPTPA